MTIEPDVTNPKREGLVTSGSMVITTKMIGPGYSGSMPSHSGKTLPIPRLQRMLNRPHKPFMHYWASNPGPRPFIFIEKTIEPDATNLSAKDLSAKD